jgi:hypothetical protein
VGGSLGKLVIRDGPNGTGTDLTGVTINLSADSSKTLYAAGYDASDNYVGDQVVDWYSTGTLDYININASSFTYQPVKAPSTGTIGITNGTFGNTTGNISVTVGALNFITINSTPGAQGAEFDTLTMSAGSSISLYATGYDSDSNYISAVVADWSSTGNLDSVGSTGSSLVFNPVIAPSTGTIVATAGLLSDVTGLISVEEGNLDHLVIRTAAGGTGVVVNTSNLTTDQSLTMYAAGYDANNNFLYDVNVSWSSTGTLDNVVGTGSSYVFNPLTANTSGTIVATSGIYSDQTGTITVAVGILNYITINSTTGATGVPVETLSLTADDTYTLYAAGYDADNNFRNMVSAVWNQTGTLDNVTGTATSYVFNPVTAPTSGTITATFSGNTDATGTITVDPGALNYIRINDAPGAGGIEIGNLTLNVGVGIVLYSVGYDQFNNLRGLESAIWRSTGSLDDVSDVSESITFTPITAPTSGTIIATSGTVSDTTGTLTVEEGVLTSIQIRTAPDGQGSEFDQHNMTADESVTLYAAGYDGGNNFIDNHEVAWTSTGTLETINATDTIFVFSPTSAPTSGTIVATSGALNDETGTITVSPGAPVSITDYDGLLGKRTTVAGSAQLIRVLVEDQHGNPVSGTTVNFSPAQFMSVSSDLTDPNGLAESVYLSPSNADSSIVQTSVIGISPYNFTVYGITYVSGSLDPLVAQRGGSPSFTLQVANPGNVAVPLSTGSSNFSFENESFNYSATLVSPTSLPPNSSAITLTFAPTLIDENFPGGSYTCGIQLVGSGSFASMNGILQTDFGELTVGSDAITIGTVQITGPNESNQFLQGDQGIIATVPVTNVGPVLEIDSFQETRIEFRRNDNGQPQPVGSLVRTDVVQSLQSGGVINELEFQFNLPTDYEVGLIDVYVRLSLDEGNLVIGPQLSGNFPVLQAGNANYVEGSLDPSVVVPQETVNFSASFENTGSANIVLSPSTSTIEILGTSIGPRNLISQFTLTGNSTIDLRFDPLLIPAGLSPGTYNIQWRLNGSLPNGSEYDSTGVITGGLTVVSAAELSFFTINVIPDRVKQGQTGIDIIYSIGNDGQSDANITGLDHQFNFNAGGAVPPNQWIPTQVEPALPVQIAPGGNIALTATYALATTATTGLVSPNPTVTYHDIKTPAIDYSSNIIAQNDQVEVVEPASIKILQLQALAPNNDTVNKGQQFSLELTLENTGADQIQTAWVSIYRIGEQESFTDQLVFTNIGAGGQKSASFQHSEPTHGTYVYKAKIDGAIDAIGDSVLINQPDDDNEQIIVQEPSRLEIDAIIVSSSGKSDSLIVSQEQTFLVRAKITNFGESSFSVDGNGGLVLDLPGNTFTLVNGSSDSLQTFTATDTMVEWSIQALGISPGGNYENLEFLLSDIPIDINTGNPVADISIVDSVVHVKSEERGKIIRSDLSILSPEGAQDGILSTKQEFIVWADIEFNSTITNGSAEINLPFGYSLKEGQQLKIDLPDGGGQVEWTIIALERDRTGDEIFVTSRGDDRNSGLPVTLPSNSIPLSVVERTNLTMTLQILKTGGSQGDTLSVGQKFTLQALINNSGTARAIGGGKVYIDGIEDNDAIIFSNLPQEDTLNYVIGEPVGWDLEVIKLPEEQSKIQTQIIGLMEELDKENAKIAGKGKNNLTSRGRARVLFNQISDMVTSLVTLEMNLTVKMAQIPEDENTDQIAYTQDSIVTKTTYIQPIAEIIIQSFDPPEIVSTEQEFDLIVTGNLINNLINPRAHLSIPHSFESSNDGPVLVLPLESGSNQAHYKITVPSTANFFGAARETLSVFLSGDDSNTGLPVSNSLPVSRIITVQMKPEIYMGREIISPLAARQGGELSHGQSITIEVWPVLIDRSDKPLDYAPIDNDGSIELDSKIFSEYNFEPIDGQTYKKTFTQLDQKLSFTIRAPRENKTALIDLNFIDLPVDNNSRNDVLVTPGDTGSVSLPITVTEKKIMVIMEDEFEKTTFTRGEGEHLMMAFEISNSDYLDPLTIQGLGLKFIARSDTASLIDNAIFNIFEKIHIVDYDEYSAGSEKISSFTSYAEYEVTEDNADNPLQINFDDVGYLNGNESVKLALVATFRSGESSRSFRTILNNVDAYDDSPQHLVSIIDSEGRPIENSPDMITQVLSIISTDQEKTFGNFPNPFGRSPNVTTEIRFVLNSTSDVTLRIFSLAGELVKSDWKTNLANLPGGEIYYLIWDGKNDEGDTVLNGVYICVIEIRGSEGTKTYTTKIAYIK